MIVALFVGKLLGWQIDGHFYSTIISAFSEIQNAHRQDIITGNRNINTETIHGTTSSVCGASMAKFYSSLYLYYTYV